MDERRDLVDRKELRRAVVKAFADHFPMAAYDRLNRAADAVLAVPAIADALARDGRAGCHAITDDDGTTYCPLAEANMRAVARDAQVAREVGTPDDRMWMSPGECAELFHEIAALYPSPGDRDDSEEQR